MINFGNIFKSSSKLHKPNASAHTKSTTASKAPEGNAASKSDSPEIPKQESHTSAEPDLHTPVRSESKSDSRWALNRKFNSPFRRKTHSSFYSYDAKGTLSDKERQFLASDKGNAYLQQSSNNMMSKVSKMAILIM